MKHRFSRFLAFSVLFVLLASLSGCRNQEKESSDSTTVVPTNTVSVDKTKGHYVLTKETVRDKDGAVESMYTYEYDAKGQKLREETYITDSTLSGYVVYEYDEAGHVTKETTGADTGDLYYVTYSYEGDNCVVEEWFDLDGTAVSRIQREYAGDKLVKETTFQNDTRVSETTHEYEQDCVVLSVYTKQDQITAKTTYTYDEDENLTVQRIASEDGREWVEILKEYDENGMVTRETRVDQDGVISYEYTYEYDESLNNTRMLTRNGEGTCISIGKSVFDEAGNELEQKVYYDEDNLWYTCSYEYQWIAE